MTHLSEGDLLALRDEPGAAAPEGHRHVASCPECQGALAGLQRQEADVTLALGLLDEGVGDLERARERVRVRVAAETARRAGTASLPQRRARMAAWSVSRAAGLVLVAAAGLSALPGSPVRSWVEERLGSGEPQATPAAAEHGAPAAPEAPEAVGVRLPVAEGPLSVVLLGAEPGTEVRVSWVPGREAAVFAPVGTRFTSGQGRVEAALAPGMVRVELPQGVAPLSLQVDGNTLIRAGATGVEVTGPVVDRSAGGIVFRISAP